MLGTRVEHWTGGLGPLSSEEATLHPKAPRSMEKIADLGAFWPENSVHPQR